jgi:hypothetical protein
MPSRRDHLSSVDARQAKGKNSRKLHLHLLDVVAIASGASANDTFPTGVTPGPACFGDTYIAPRERVVSMNAREVTTKVVLPAERPATVAVRASVGFRPVRVVSGHVRLKIECSGESYRKPSTQCMMPEHQRLTASTLRTLVFAAGVQLLLLKSGRRGNQ